MAKADLIKRIDDLIGEYDPDIVVPVSPEVPWSNAHTIQRCGVHDDGEYTLGCSGCLTELESKLTTSHRACLSSVSYWRRVLAPLLRDLREELNDAQT